MRRREEGRRSGCVHEAERRAAFDQLNAGALLVRPARPARPRRAPGCSRCRAASPVPGSQRQNSSGRPFSTTTGSAAALPPLDQLAHEPDKVDLAPERPVEADGGPRSSGTSAARIARTHVRACAALRHGQGLTLRDQACPLGLAPRLHLVRQPHPGSSSSTAFSTTALLRASSRAANSRVTGPRSGQPAQLGQRRRRRPSRSSSR